MCLDLRTNRRDGCLRPGPLVVVVVVLGSVQGEQEGEVRIGQRRFQEQPLVEQGVEALQCVAVQDVDGAQHPDDGILDVLVGVLGEHLDEIVELTGGGGDLGRHRLSPGSHGDSPLP